VAFNWINLHASVTQLLYLAFSGTGALLAAMQHQAMLLNVHMLCLQMKDAEAQQVPVICLDWYVLQVSSMPNLAESL